MARLPDSASPIRGAVKPDAFLIDLALYLPVMFLIRGIYFPALGFIVNGLFWSLTTLVFATWRIRARGVAWTDLGLRRPRNITTASIATVVILGMAVALVVAFQIFLEQFQLGLAADTSNASAVERFGSLRGNWTLFLAILPLIWLESFLEELLDRGFLMNWIERVFAGHRFATALAVILQAMIFGFRHSQDLSERSVTVALIGLTMGIGYVAFGRNLWPLILAHCGLNTVSMIERVA